MDLSVWGVVPQADSCTMVADWHTATQGPIWGEVLENVIYQNTQNITATRSNKSPPEID